MRFQYYEYPRGSWRKRRERLKVCSLSECPARAEIKVAAADKDMGRQGSDQVGNRSQMTGASASLNDPWKACLSLRQRTDVAVAQSLWRTTAAQHHVRERGTRFFRSAPTNRKSSTKNSRRLQLRHIPL
jgi:hypothetical protein